MKKRGIAILIVLLVAFFLSLFFDSEVVGIISFIRNAFLDNFFLGIAFVSSEAVLLIILTCLFLFKERKRKWIFPLWFSIALSALMSFALKIIVKRQRPYQIGIVSILEKLQEASHNAWNFSFPSSHSMIAFCAVPILVREFPKFKYVWIGFATLIAFSRLYFGLHFLSDIIAGVIIGYLIGSLIVKLENKKRFGEKAYKKLKGIFKK
jgi:undecaprenyl-diphosphatase